MDLGKKAKKILEDYVPVIEEKLSKYFDKELSLGFGFNARQKEMVETLLKHAKEHNLRSAKRLRGSFVNYGYKLSGKEVDDRVWRAAMGVEIVHTALLMHDDFMDQDEIRRGGPTTHKYLEKEFKSDLHFGESMAVSVGDAILCLGFELVFGADGKDKVMKQLFRGIVNTAFGQAYDVALEAREKWTEDDVITLHKAKTAIYTYHNSLIIGVNLAGIDDDRVLRLLYDYSMDGGVAFQLQDDILGVFGTPEKTGKSADSDILHGKCTLLVLKTLESGTKDQQAAIKRVWGRGKASEKELIAAKQAVVASGSYKYSKELAKKYAKRAALTAGKLRNIPSLNPEAIDYIQGIAEYMVNREV